MDRCAKNCIPVLTLHPLNQQDTSSLNFIYTDSNKNNWSLSGYNRQKLIKVELQRINPDTMTTLKKIKRKVIVFDDWSDQE